jgi:hypothetical protein
LIEPSALRAAKAHYLSLAEVQVMGTDPLRFPEVDYSSAQNDFVALIVLLLHYHLPIQYAVITSKVCESDF